MTRHPEYTTLDPQATLDLPLDGVRLIEASAGTGKTYAIGNLYLRHILAGRPVNRILVVTFTNAATEELRGRIRERLYETLQLLREQRSAADDFLRLLLRQIQQQGECTQAIDRLKLAVRSMDEAAIHTIHGFCQRALTDHAFHSGQPFNMELTSDDADLWHEALKDWWRIHAYSLGRQDIALFSSALGSLEDFVQLQTPLRQASGKTLLPETNGEFSDIWERWHALEADLTEIAASWQQRAEEISSVLRDSPALSRAKTLPFHEQNLPGFLAVVHEYFSSSNLLNFPAEFEVLSPSYLEANSTNKKRGSDPDLRDGFFQACEDVIGKRDMLQRDLRVLALKEATAFAAKQVELTKQKQQTLAFHDQLIRLHGSLQGPAGKALAHHLRQRFPVAMIDEFQDTDSIQYGIFRMLYQGMPDTSLIMIGDPKQAIYSFRGGDIFTYMQAKADAAENGYTLDTNWRSVPGLISAVNHLFTLRPAPFIYADAIDYQEVKWPEPENLAAPRALLAQRGRPVPPLTVWQIPLAANGKPQSKTAVSADMANATAGEIARLLGNTETGSYTLGDRAVKPGDIAVLVRNGFEAGDVRQALQSLGISAVTVGRDKVFGSEEAHGLDLLLQAVIDFRDRTAVRTALASSLLNLGYGEIAEILLDEQRWQQWNQDLRELHQQWQKKGFMSMFQNMLNSLGIGQRLATTDLPQRRLTNLLHLAELLQQASRTHPGLDSLLSWYRRQAVDAGVEEAELRLESDDELVKIATIHASKGLEYPIVFLPYLWGCRGAAWENKLVAFHDGSQRGFLDSAADKNSASLILSEKERLAEDIRLAYVAVTRAKAKVYLAWGAVTSGGKNACTSAATALGYLLYPRQQPQDLDSAFPQAFSGGDDLAHQLQNLADKSRGNIELTPLPDIAGIAPAQAADADTPPLSPSRFHGEIVNDWRIASFSGMTRDIHQLPHGGSQRATDDPILNFPAGSQTGSFLHLLLEQLDFQSDLEPQSAALTSQLATRFNLDTNRYQDTISQWLGNIVNTAMDDDGLSLKTLANEKRLNELEFDFAIGQVDIGALNEALDRAAGQSLARLGIDDFRGMITGIIDLVFEHNGKFYVADYKSNFLGNMLDDYRPDKLRQAVLDRRYDLQYLLYSLAVHRYLKQRLKNYSYQAHFGGVYYLFLRGMRPASGASYGIYHNLPEWQLVSTLDEHILAVDNTGGGQ